MRVVRAELCGRLDALRAMSRGRRDPRFAENVSGLKRLAALYGLDAVVRLADGLERSAAGDGRAPSLYLGRLEDAIGCDQAAGEACEALLASISVRYCA
jgi:hypothetical protein